MSIGKKFTIGLLVAIIVIGAGGGYFKITSDRSSNQDSTVETPNKDFVKVNNTELSLKDGKAKLKVTLSANTSAKVTGDDDVIKPIDWTTSTEERRYILVLKNNGTYYVEAKNGNETKKIKIVVGDGEDDNSESSSSEENSSEAESESEVESVSSSTVTPAYTSRTTTPATVQQPVASSTAHSSTANNTLTGSNDGTSSNQDDVDTNSGDNSVGGTTGATVGR